MSAILDYCFENDVLAGAHPSFPDKENFGRIAMDIPFGELTNLLIYQIAALQGLAFSKGGQLYHVKPHGALYNMACKEEKEAKAVVKAILKLNPSLVLYAPENALMTKLALAAGLTVQYEVFADRNYNPDLSLVSRKADNAVIHQPKDVCKHVLHLYQEKAVKCIDGISRPLKADTYCVHGDNPQVIPILQALQQLDFD